MADHFYLAEWRRIVAEMYAAVRNAPDAGRMVAWQDWRARRNNLFKNHPQSPLEEQQRTHFRGLSYFDYSAAWRVTGKIDRNVERKTLHIQLDEDKDFHIIRIARAIFELDDLSGRLNIYWVKCYGGGLFIPFKDASNSIDTFGGGRYLYDTIKGVDLGVRGDEIILDFNYAYNPSCAYHSRWICPLAPVENTLPFHVTAGEKNFAQQDSNF